MSKTLAGRRKERGLIRNCTALTRILRCFGANILWCWPLSTTGWNDPSIEYESTGACAACAKTRMDVLRGNHGELNQVRIKLERVFCTQLSMRALSRQRRRATVSVTHGDTLGSRSHGTEAIGKRNCWLFQKVVNDELKDSQNGNSKLVMHESTDSRSENSKSVESGSTDEQHQKKRRWTHGCTVTRDNVPIAHWLTVIDKTAFHNGFVGVPQVCDERHLRLRPSFEVCRLGLHGLDSACPQNGHISVGYRRGRDTDDSNGCVVRACRRKTSERDGNSNGDVGRKLLRGTISTSSCYSF